MSLSFCLQPGILAFLPSILCLHHFLINGIYNLNVNNFCVTTKCNKVDDDPYVALAFFFSQEGYF